MNVPQIKSIWIDEDDETEKLYGVHGRHMMDSDEDDELGVVLINSDKPVLKNRKNIDLPPLPPNAYKESTNRKSFTKKKKSLLKLFQNKSSKAESPKLKISVPFGFNHISHADSKAGFETPVTATSTSESKTQELVDTTVESSPSKAHSAAPITKAFVTDAIPYDNMMLTSRASSTKRSSMGSSTYSNPRIMSTSTMATSLLNDAHSRSISKLTTLERTHLKHKYSKSESSELDMEFLKNYQFPTLLEEQSILQVSTPDMNNKKLDKFQWDSPSNSAELLETMMLNDLKNLPVRTVTPKHSLKRNSDPVMTPVLRPSEYLDTPRTRRSVDDVLLCYLQSSDAGSSLNDTASEFSFARNSKIYHKQTI